MKIFAIRGKNLASLESEFEIDFMSEPLCSAGIFAITGPTGAGKSTLLDALCLALFDDAPRLSKAEQLKIEDENQDNITLKDSRNILRKGAAEGYAEVEFIALNGDRYRSRWTVRRARGKVDGALQNTSLRLENLSTTTEEQGTKKDILVRITEIIGLTFDQFTRAVLLAQGDFATFLKARQNEKAELLEKLTGTEIYSKISALIFQRTADAKSALDLIEQRKSDIKLLSEEELQTLNCEKSNLSRESDPIRNLLSVIEKKLEWLKQQDVLTQEIILAENNLKAIRNKISEAAPRYDYIAKLDQAQEIRDNYLDAMNKHKDQTRLTSVLEIKEKELLVVIQNTIKAEADLKILKSQLDDLDQKYIAIRPDLDRAKELDILLRSAGQQISEINKSLEVQQHSLKRTEMDIVNLQAQQENVKQEKNLIEKWFVENKQYENIVSGIGLIESLLNTIRTIGKQKENAAKSLESSRGMLQTYTSQLKLYESEAERLNALLPAEILNLRENLEDGEPCPVCGSLHHPMAMFSNQIMGINKEELDIAKKKVAEDLVKIKENIESTQKSITEFQTHISAFEERYVTDIESLEESLSFLPDWKSKLEDVELQQELSTKAFLWNENKVKLQNTSRLIETALLKMEAEQKSLAVLKDDIAQRSDDLEKQSVLLNKYTEERTHILKGKSVDEIELRYSFLKDDYSKKYETQRIIKEKSESEKAGIEGIITQMRVELEANTEHLHKLDADIRSWLNNNQYGITEELLQDLITKTKQWVDSERSYLADIRNQELVLVTTLQERTDRLSKHSESENKPVEEETRDSLLIHQAEVALKNESIINRLTEVQVALNTHAQGADRIRLFENELKTKAEVYNNWSKLNDLLGSASGNKFKTIAQGYTLDVLLGYANKHLEELTKRYRLEKIPNTLALQVIDNDMLGEVRTVHSLSGGESFLISLSLALGLSSLSSNRMKIESLFIDEGFGSLDVETLGVAMDALESLQTQGRKIGIISHVEEMKERITTQIQVTKAPNGKSIVKVTGY